MQRRIRWGLLSLVFVGSALRVLAVFQHNPLELLITDPGRWWYSATHLSSTQPMAAIDPFGYPLWLGIFIRIAGSNATAIGLHNAALSVLTPWIWYRLIRELIDNREVSLAGWAILAWLPSWIAIYSYTMSETLFLPFFGVALWCSVKAYQKGSTFAYSVAALVWALCSAIRVFALPCALIVLVWINRRRIHRARKIVGATIAFAIVVVPLSIRTERILGVWSPFGFPKMNQIYMESGKRTLRLNISRDSGSYRWSYEFRSPSMSQAPLKPLSDWKSSRAGTAYFVVNEDKGLTQWNWAQRLYQPTLQRRIDEWHENYVMFNFAPSWPDNNPNRFWDRAATSTRWFWLPLAVLAIAGNFCLRRQLGVGTTAMISVLSALAWTLTPLLPAVMEGRYRKPLLGLLIVNLMLLLHYRKVNPFSGMQSGTQDSPDRDIAASPVG